MGPTGPPHASELVGPAARRVPSSDPKVRHVAEQERLTNKERRVQAREERKRKEEAARKRAQKQRLKGGAVAAVITALVAFTVFQAFFNAGPSLEGDTIEIAASEVDDLREAAGCEVVTERSPLPESFHFEGNEEPPADSIYTDTRPTHSGPHLGQVSAVSEDGYSSQVSETATTHNLEHGAVIVWFDPEQAADEDVSAISDWNQTLNNSGFREDPRTGAGVTSSPYEDPGISSGQTFAFRAWGTAMDCEAWDEDVANAFVAEHYGTRGIAPEGTFGGYPEGAVELVDDDGEAIVPGPSEPEIPDDAELDEDALEESDADEEDVPDELENEPEGDDAEADDAEADDENADDDES